MFHITYLGLCTHIEQIEKIRYHIVVEAILSSTVSYTFKVVEMNNSHRITPGTMGRISQSAELEDEGAHETNSKFEKGNEHAGFQTGEM